jgi:uncharacterized protein YmfQ (DUF2313 family)
MALTDNQKKWRMRLVLEGEGPSHRVTEERWERYFNMPGTDLAAEIATAKQEKIDEKRRILATHNEYSAELQAQIDAIQNEGA